MGAGYIAGTLLAIAAGAVNNLGVLIQKKAVNTMSAAGVEGGLMRSLIRSRLWLSGVALQIGAGTPMYVAAQFFIGPTLVPGLMATGLIVLALGSPAVAGEPIRRIDYLGMALVVVAVALFGLSRLAVDLGATDLFGGEPRRRFLVMNALVWAMSLALVIASRPMEPLRGWLLILAAGLSYALGNLWLGVGAAFVGRMVAGELGSAMFAGLAVSLAAILAGNVLSLVWTQQAFRFGRAAALIPLQQAPMQILPALSYFVVFLGRPPDPASPWLAGAGVLLILAGAALLGSRRAA